ncbi:hypothetical protein GCM10009804_22960 [Kribbella hippodromi]|uniref:Nudix hydrolase domain-containing protein n=1 Tax=Kribbella hippodromi TaxID=434347 RepID=A0ABP4NSU8_9ACTN
MVKIPRAAAVVVQAGKVLVIKRYLRKADSSDCVMCEYASVSGPRCGGHAYAVLPGGHVEAGESASVAALRELWEETTLTANVDELLWTGTHNGRPAYYFRVRDVEGTPRLSGAEAEEHCPTNSFELRWAEASELVEFGFYPAELVGRLRELLEVSDQVG